MRTTFRPCLESLESRESPSGLSSLLTSTSGPLPTLPAGTTAQTAAVSPLQALASNPKELLLLVAGFVLLHKLEGAHLNSGVVAVALGNSVVSVEGRP